MWWKSFFQPTSQPANLSSIHFAPELYFHIGGARGGRGLSGKLFRVVWGADPPGKSFVVVLWRNRKFFRGVERERQKQMGRRQMKMTMNILRWIASHVDRFPCFVFVSFSFSFDLHLIKITKQFGNMQTERTELN